MHFLSCLAMFAVILFVANTAPTADGTVDNDTTLRLIKTSEADPGTWVTEEEKISKYVAKKINFFDITDIKDAETLHRLSTTDRIRPVEAAIVYPTTLTHQPEANALIAKTDTTGPKSWLQTLTNFYNRYYRSTYGTQAATWLSNQIKSISASNPAITLTQIPNSFSQPNIIARIPGQTSALVIIGAHFDSTGGSSTARGPGADDNGSGVITILEALRVLSDSKFTPKNTLEFHFYASEEGGLLGSQTVWANYKAAKKTVLAFLNQDMAGYSPSGKISVYSDYVDQGLTAYVRRIVSGYIGGAPTSDACGYACSDHASAEANGFREFFFSLFCLTGNEERSTDEDFGGIAAAYACDEPDKTSDPNIHSPNDAYSTVMWDTVQRHIKFTMAFLVEASYL